VVGEARGQRLSGRGGGRRQLCAVGWAVGLRRGLDSGLGRPAWTASGRQTPACGPAGGRLAPHRRYLAATSLPPHAITVAIAKARAHLEARRARVVLLRREGLLHGGLPPRGRGRGRRRLPRGVEKCHDLPRLTLVPRELSRHACRAGSCRAGLSLRPAAAASQRSGAPPRGL
jgi:hypothetical protein